MPLAAYATMEADTLHIKATWGDPEGVLPLVHAQAQGQVEYTEAAVHLGEQVALELQRGVHALSNPGV